MAAWIARNLFLAGVALAFADTSHADVPEALDRVALSLGGFFPTVDARVSANGPQVAGTDVDFQKDLGLDHRRTLTSLRLDLLVFDSQGFSIGGYNYSKQARVTLARDIQFDGNEYDASAFVSAQLRLQTIDAAWHWWLAPSAADVVGIGLGAAYYDIRGAIDGGITVNGDSASAHGEAAGNAVAPLLTLGWRHAFTPNLRGYADFSGVRKPSGTLTGHLLNGTVGAEYYPWRNLGLAFEYSINDLELQADKRSWQGRASIQFRGPAAFVRLRY